MKTCKGTSQPESDIEKVWAVYLSALRRKKIYFTASSAAVEGGGSDSMDSDD